MQDPEILSHEKALLSRLESLIRHAGQTIISSESDAGIGTHTFRIEGDRLVEVHRSFLDVVDLEATRRLDGWRLRDHFAGMLPGDKLVISGDAPQVTRFK